MTETTQKLVALVEALERKEESLSHHRRSEGNPVTMDRMRKEIDDITAEIEKLKPLAQAEEFAEEARKYISMAKQMVDANKKEMADAIRVFLGLLLDVKKDIEPELDALSRLRAVTDYRDYENLKMAGFKAPEAFQIFLARIKPLGNAFVQNMTSAASTVSATEKMAPAVGKVAKKAR
ncbi:MAG: hypothetical protein V1867_06985 [Candidatus Falkowbacteria bacterium]